MTARQIEAARIAMTRHVKRGGKIWIRVFPDKPITKKPAETRMGKGKGNPEEWVAVVRPAACSTRWKASDRGRTRGVPPGAQHKLPHADEASCSGRSGHEGRASSAKALGSRSSRPRASELRRRALQRARVKKATGQLENTAKLLGAPAPGRRPLWRPSCAKSVERISEATRTATDLEGVVVSDKMDKTVVVRVERLVKDTRLPEVRAALLALHGPRRRERVRVGDKVRSSSTARSRSASAGRCRDADQGDAGLGAER